jgi:hypothetical protein
MNEHSNLDYRNQLESSAAGYASFLDHMCSTISQGETPTSAVINFPYLRSPCDVRALFPSPSLRARPPRIWLEARTIILAATGEREGLWTPECDEYLLSLNQRFDVEIRSRSRLYKQYYNVQDPSMPDAISYLRDMRRADFFIGSNAVGAGQSLADAASLGLLCFGTSKLVYHRMICPDFNLDMPLEETIETTRRLWENPQELFSAIAKQDDRLTRKMIKSPVGDMLNAGIHHV